MDLVVATGTGMVRGARFVDGVIAFRGIPYAAPPIGPARLLAPQPPSPWQGVRDALDFGPVPPQPVGMPGMPKWTPDSGDDVLTVNVWTPEHPDGARPVLFWIYGGAYTNGSADGYVPVELVRAGLVVVTVNYRLGFEGFGHVPGAQDNRGLLDQIAALKWVRDNISAFGGDPEKVTVAGQSAGAGAVAALGVMPRANGLFHRGIAHSVPCEFFSVDVAAAIGEQVAAAAGVEYSAEAMSTLPAEELLAASAQVSAHCRSHPETGVRYYLPTIYNPVVDGEVLPADPLDATNEVDLLVLHTVDEFRMFSVLGLAPAVKSEAELAQAAAAFGLSDLAAYRELVPEASVSDVYAMIATDHTFGEYSTRLAEVHARSGGRAFLARFAWQSRVFGGALKALHGADLPFSFGDLVGGPLSRLVLGGPPTDEDLALAQRMRDAWVDFVVTGDPGWPAVTPATTTVKIWNTVDDLVVDNADGLRALWRRT